MHGTKTQKAILEPQVHQTELKMSQIACFHFPRHIT